MVPELQRSTWKDDWGYLARPRCDAALARFHSSDGGVRDFFILSIDADRSSLHLIGTQDPQEIIVPVDAVQMIWREPNIEVFHVSLNGRIVPTSTRELHFHP
jgi:hypothetical protein